MLYQLTPALSPVEPAHLNPETLTAGLITREELPQMAAPLGLQGIALEDSLSYGDNYRNTIDVFEHYTLGILNIVDANNIYQTSDRVAIVLKRNLFLLIVLQDENDSLQESFQQAIRRFTGESATLEKLIYAFIERDIARDPQALAKIAFQINDMEEAVAEGQVHRHFNAQIFEQKRRLLLLRNYYEQLIDLGEDLQGNENNLFAGDTLHYFSLFTVKAERLSSTVQRLLDTLGELRSAHQAAMDYSLNRVMKLFSVITTIFLPLTLIVGWYGMNFTHMPELAWEHGYPFVIGLSLAVVGLTLYLFKKKKLL